MKESNIVISAHAAIRLKQRLGVPENKMQKVAFKAWCSKVSDVPRLNQAEYNSFVYTRNRTARFMMGKTFIFADLRDDRNTQGSKILITVI